MRERRETLSFLSFLPRLERPLLAGKPNARRLRSYLLKSSQNIAKYCVNTMFTFGAPYTCEVVRPTIRNGMQNNGII